MQPQIPKNNYIPFGELYSENSRNGLSISENHRGKGIKIVNMGELFNYQFIGSQSMKRVNINQREYERNKLLDGDLLFGRRSLVEKGAGKCIIVNSLNEPTTFESSIIRVRLNKKISNPFFYYYYFLSYEGRGKIKSLITGANVMGIKGSDLKKLQVLSYPIKVQNKIASFLLYFDRLIENNRRRIEILEEQAQLLYRDWFVEFRFPGHEKVKFIDFELGKIPEGWKVEKIGKNLKIKRGKMITGNTITEGSVPVVAGGLTPAYYHNTHNVKAPVVTISSSGANSGYVNLYQENIWASDCSYISKKETNFVYYYFLQLKTRQFEVTNLQKGSAQPHVYSKDVMDLETIYSGEKMIEAFEIFIEPVFKLKNELTLTNLNLVENRDLLLPKLMSGEIEV